MPACRRSWVMKSCPFATGTQGPVSPQPLNVLKFRFVSSPHFGYQPGLDPALAQFAMRRKRDEQRSLLLLMDGEPGFERSHRAWPGLQPG